MTVTDTHHAGTAPRTEAPPVTRQPARQPDSQPGQSVSQPVPALDPQALRSAFGTFPSGVVAVAAQSEGRLIGIAASSFTSVSLDPPLVQVCVATGSNTWPALREAGRLGVSVLAEHHDTVCRQLAGPADRRFEGLSLSLEPGGAVLLDEAVTGFSVTVHDEIEAGDHTLVLLRIHEVIDGGSHDPLVFHRSSFGKLHRDDAPALTGRINGEPVA